MSNSAYPIRRIRLINFHNFTNETIELENNGHLFLLGDNGCGKTTILDAVHYALTAGKGMEWNSAARMGGQKRDGRRVQGIVLRYNLDTGIMNKNGAITYVALEIVGRNGIPLAIGMGMSTTAMDERISFWAFIRECPLTDLPLLTEENGQMRPSSRLEFKQRLESSHGYYTNQANYRKDIADRLFGGEESYKDICRFLSMGKSYREISAGAADYHELFKSLLPEPRSSIFEQIINALRTLDESQTILDDLERKLAWLSGLQVKVDEIAEHRLAIIRYDWLLSHFTEQEKANKKIVIKDHLQRKTAQLATDQDALATLTQQEKDLEERLNNLQAKDSSGLVRQEKSCREELAGKQAELDLEKEQEKILKQHIQKNDKEQDQAQTNFLELVTRLLPELAKRSLSLPFSVSDLQTEIDQLRRSRDFSAIKDPDYQVPINQCDSFGQQYSAQCALLEQQKKDNNKEIEHFRKLLDELEERSEIVPHLGGYQGFHTALRNAMLTPRPMYLGLEWVASVPKQQRQYIEECIGEDILAIMVLRQAEYPQAREICAGYPGLRISSDKPDTSITLPDWMRKVFDLKESDPDCLRCLALEMASSGWQPQISLVTGRPVLAFRGHERRLHEIPARLIGGESRQKALAMEIGELKKQLVHLAAIKKEITRQIEATTGQQQILNDFKTFLHDRTKAIRDHALLVQQARHVAASSRTVYDNQQRATEKLGREVDSLAVRAKELTELVSKEGLDNLEKRIKTITNKRTALKKLCADLTTTMGGDQREIAQMHDALLVLDKELATLADQKENIESILREILPVGSDPAHYILKSKKGQQFKSREAIQNEGENCRVAARTGTIEIKTQLNDPQFGGAFRFTYDEEKNQLLDFRQQTIGALIEQQTRDLAEQQEVISERTRELFKKIIMTDLMQYLRGHVGELDQMVRRINTLLSNRSFGGQRYSFKLRPLDAFKRLITIIKKINPFDPSVETELAAFFADHHDTIIGTETGTIPEELDYRNWYRYEMEVATLGEEGKVIDRKNKSIGSGGEQAVPNYLLILTIAHFMYRGQKTKIHALLFDEAFYGIDAGRRDQILGFATDLGLQLFIASPDQDGVRQEIRNSTTLLVKKDTYYDIHLYPFHWRNPSKQQMSLLHPNEEPQVTFDEEI